MSIVLYELHGRDNHRFSPFVWRTLMALAHKGLEAERVPMKFTDRDCIAFSGQDRVPVLVDGERWVNDSWRIACYLEDAYPDAPSLFGGSIGRGAARFISHWTDRVLHPAISRVMIRDVWEHTHPDDRAWFRKSREGRYGQSLEALHETREAHVEPLRKALDPFRATLGDQPFLCGDRPAYGDYILFGGLQWARCCSPLPVIAPDDPIYAWRGRMLELFDGFAGRAAGYSY